MDNIVMPDSVLESLKSNDGDYGECGPPCSWLRLVVVMMMMIVKMVTVVSVVHLAGGLVFASLANFMLGLEVASNTLWIHNYISNEADWDF